MKEREKETQEREKRERGREKERRKERERERRTEFQVKKRETIGTFGHRHSFISVRLYMFVAVGIRKPIGLSFDAPKKR